MISYSHSLEGIRPSHLHGFFVGWRNPPTAETHLQVLAASSHIVVARNDETGQVAGFITAISDGILSAYIPLLEVLPEHQGQGIGTELLRRLLKELDGLYMVDLICDPDKQSFYERFGLKRAPGMIIRNYERQPGNPSSSESDTDR